MYLYDIIKKNQNKFPALLATLVLYLLHIFYIMNKHRCTCTAHVYYIAAPKLHGVDKRIAYSSY